MNMLSVFEVPRGRRQVVHTSRDLIRNPAVSPDGKRIAYAAGSTERDVLEISLLDGEVHSAGRSRSIVVSGLGAIGHSFPCRY
jgi:hypothetical protein